MKSRSKFEKFKDFYEYGSLVELTNPRVGYIIKVFCVMSIHSDYKKNANILKETEKEFLQKETKALHSIKIDNEKPDIVMYTNFVQDVFKKADEEDRNGRSSINTALAFRRVVDLIRVMELFGDIEKEWKEKSKLKLNSLGRYCKYKSLEIIKYFKKGLSPKRGYPDEINESFENIKDTNDEFDFEKELEFLSKEVEHNKKTVSLNSQMQSKLENNKNNTHLLSTNSGNQTYEIKRQVITLTKKDEPKESKLKLKKLNINLPVEKYSLDYFNLIDHGRNYIKSAISELERGNINNSLILLETIRANFNQIK